MIPRRSESRLLCPADIQPAQDNFAVIGVFNPGVVRIKNEVLILVRAAPWPSRDYSVFWENENRSVLFAPRSRAAQSNQRSRSSRYAVNRSGKKFEADHARSTANRL
jgi:predicted GH43/DUF377 family glycosyl hydrolase